MAPGNMCHPSKKVASTSKDPFQVLVQHLLALLLASKAALMRHKMGLFE
jgi:hypothetical protein